MRIQILRIREAAVTCCSICGDDVHAGGVFAGLKPYCETCYREILELEELARKESVDHYAIQRGANLSTKCRTEGCDGLALAMYGDECRDCWEFRQWQDREAWERNDPEYLERAARRRKALHRTATALELLVLGGGLFYLGCCAADAVMEWINAGGWQ